MSKPTLEDLAKIFPPLRYDPEVRGWISEIVEFTDEHLELLKRLEADDPQTILWDDPYHWHTEDKNGKITGYGISTPKCPRPSTPN